eukprot:snap_masked-scaffold_2-processed-gene-1.23-mRNA-1 protein AED:0.08 eAED:1.00 QI:0/-1/0/1/-1/1/1/0/444
MFREKRKREIEDVGDSDRLIPRTSMSPRVYDMYSDLEPGMSDKATVQELENILGVRKSRRQILSYDESTSSTMNTTMGSFLVQDIKPRTKYKRHISSKPERILDAPAVVDDFKNNPIDWSIDNKVAVSLSDIVYLWDGNTGETKELFCTEGEEDENIITAVKFSNKRDSFLVLGTENEKGILVDTLNGKSIRSFRGQKSRINSICLNTKYGIFTTTGNNERIISHDFRQRESAVIKFRHSKDISCVNSTAWNFQGSENGNLLSTGDCEGVVKIWDIRKHSTSEYKLKPLKTIRKHKNAVKALNWNPLKSDILATGADEQINIWNVAFDKPLFSSRNTGSEITSVHFSGDKSKFNEIVSTHESGEIKLWSNELELKKDLQKHSHKGRIIQSVVSPCQNTLLTIGADETLMFWKMFETNSILENKKQKKDNEFELSPFSRLRMGRQ